MQRTGGAEGMHNGGRGSRNCETSQHLFFLFFLSVLGTGAAFVIACGSHDCGFILMICFIGDVVPYESIGPIARNWLSTLLCFGYGVIKRRLCVEFHWSLCASTSSLTTATAAFTFSRIFRLCQISPASLTMN